MGRLPENVAVQLSGVSLSVKEGPHPFEAENLDEINRNWSAELKEKPRLFDGQLTMFDAHDFTDGHLTARCHLVRFATFLYWRKVAPVAGAEHFFAHAVPVTHDNSLIAIRMASHTANAGQVYFAAGSFDPNDFRSGLVDIEANMVREVMEETGLDLGAAKAETRYTALHFGGQTVLFRRYQFDMDTSTVSELVDRHLKNDRDPEIDGTVAIRNGCALPEGLTSYMPGIIDWHFSNFDTL
jgi:8-oxo-dGTP pyrophosphatase MutT (NUDIX family)